ncbi:MAG: MarR family transcriptional regulator [Burkholderiales bacterium]
MARTRPRTAGGVNGRGAEPAAADPRLHDLYRRPGHLLRRAHQASVAVFADECGSLGLTPAQYGVLAALDALGEIDQAGLARALGLDAATAGQVLRGLERRGLVMRRASASDRRRTNVRPTAAGRRLAASATAGVRRAQRRLLAPLSASERRRLLALLARIAFAERPR